MSARTDDLDKKSRQLEGQRAEKGQEFAQMQQYQQQIHAINAERQQNLALQKQDISSDAEMSEMLSQAGAMAAFGGGGASAAQVVQQPAIQPSAFGKPGTTHKQGREVRVKPNNITISNTYNTTTTNNISGGPVQGRPIQIQSSGGSAEEKGQAKFKTWMSNVFAQQKEANARRSKEYERREWSLTKSVNKMLRKMEGAAKDVSETFNPKNIGSTVGNQFKVLMYMFAIKFLVRNWDKIMNIGKSIYSGILDVVGFFGIGDRGAKKRREGTDLRGRLIWFLTGDPQKARDPKVSVFGVFKDIFSMFADHIKLWLRGQMEIRGLAIKSIKFPDLNLGGGGGDMPGWASRLLSGLGDVFSRVMSGVSTYLGDILTAIVNPQAAAAKGVSRTMESIGKESSESAIKRSGTNQAYFTQFSDFTDEQGNKQTGFAGDYALVTGDRAGNKLYTMSRTTLDSSGKLADNTSASVWQGRDVLGAYEDAKKYGALDVSRVYAGLSRLKDTSESKGSVILDEEFVNRMFGGDIGSIPGLTRERMKYVWEKADDRTKNVQHQVFMDDFGYGSVGKAIKEGADTAGDWLEEGVTRAGGMMLGPVGTIAGTVAGKAGNFLVDTVGAGVGALGTAIGAGQASKWEKDFQLKLVPESDPRPVASWNGKPTQVAIFYKATPEAMEALMKRFDPNGSGNMQLVVDNIKNHIISSAGGREAVDRAWNTTGQSSGYFSAQEVGANQIQEAIQNQINIMNKAAANDQALANDAFSQWKNQFTSNAGTMFSSAVDGAVNLAKNAVRTISTGWNGVSIGPAGNAGYGSGSNVHVAGVNAGAGGFTDKGEVANRVAYVMQQFTNAGMSKAAAAGIVGNLLSEGLRSKNIGTSGAYKDGSGRSFGIAGFNSGGAWPALQRFASAHGMNINSLETQVAFLMSTPQFRKIAQVTRGMSDREALQRAAVIWGHDFERFKGHDAGNSRGDIVSRGTPFVWRDKKGVTHYKYGDENYMNRIQTSAGVYNRFSGVSLTSVTYTSSGSGTISYSGGGGTYTSSPASSGAKIGCCGDSWMQGMWNNGKLGEKLRSRGFVPLGIQAHPSGLTSKAGKNWNKNATFLGGANADYVKYFIQYAVNQGCDAIVINDGLNDSCNINRVAPLGKLCGNAKVYFCNIPVPLRDADNRAFMREDNIRKYNAALAEVCKQNGWNVIDFYSLGDVGCSNYHPGAQGYNKLAEKVVNTLVSGGVVGSGYSGGTGSVNPGWPDAVQKVANWYMNNVHSYGSGVHINAPLPGGATIDCTGFVSACLRVFTGDNSMVGGSEDFANPNSAFGKKMQQHGFVPLQFSWSSVQQWDIFSVFEGRGHGQSHHSEVYYGKVDGKDRSYSWGNIHDVQHGGMPSATSKKNYQIMWRNGGGGGSTYSGDFSDFNTSYGGDGFSGGGGGGFYSGGSGSLESTSAETTATTEAGGTNTANAPDPVKYESAMLWKNNETYFSKKYGSFKEFSDKYDKMTDKEREKLKQKVENYKLVADKFSSLNGLEQARLISKLGLESLKGLDKETAVNIIAGMSKEDFAKFSERAEKHLKDIERRRTFDVDEWLKDHGQYLKYGGFKFGTWGDVDKDVTKEVILSLMEGDREAAEKVIAEKFKKQSRTSYKNTQEEINAEQLNDLEKYIKHQSAFDDIDAEIKKLTDKQAKEKETLDKLKKLKSYNSSEYYNAQEFVKLAKEVGYDISSEDPSRSIDDNKRKQLFGHGGIFLDTKIRELESKLGRTKKRLENEEETKKELVRTEKIGIDEKRDSENSDLYDAKMSEIDKLKLEKSRWEQKLESANEAWRDQAAGEDELVEAYEIRESATKRLDEINKQLVDKVVESNKLLKDQRKRANEAAKLLGTNIEEIEKAYFAALKDTKSHQEAINRIRQEYGEQFVDYLEKFNEETNSWQKEMLMRFQAQMGNFLNGDVVLTGDALHDALAERRLAQSMGFADETDMRYIQWKSGRVMVDPISHQLVIKGNNLSGIISPVTGVGLNSSYEVAGAYLGNNGFSFPKNFGLSIGRQRGFSDMLSNINENIRATNSALSGVAQVNALGFSGVMQVGLGTGSNSSGVGVGSRGKTPKSNYGYTPASQGFNVPGRNSFNTSFSFSGGG